MTDWYAIKFLESAENIRRAIKSDAGRKPSASVARDIAACLQQGRLFFEAAASSPLQIRPLQLYYGFVSFAQAIIIAKKMKAASTLPRAHGLSDVTAYNASLDDLALACRGQGTFQEFNDTIAPLGRIALFEDTTPNEIRKSFDRVEKIEKCHISLKDILSRLPGLIESYPQTFQLPANAMAIQFYKDWPGTTHRVKIAHLCHYSNKDELVVLIKQMREDYPFLSKWRFAEASQAWGRTTIYFDNINKDNYDDLADHEIMESSSNAFVSCRSLINSTLSPIPITDMISPLSGGYTESSLTCAIRPLKGAYINEHSLQFLASFLLSTLVRYRPQTWQYAISRSYSAQRLADDHSLSLIEMFLDQVLYDLPLMIPRVFRL